MQGNLLRFFYSTTLTLAHIVPDGVSITTSVCGSHTGTSPASTAYIAQPMDACPHIFTHLFASMKTTPNADAVCSAGRISAPTISLCPLGSHIKARREMVIPCSRISFFSIIVMPGISGKPEVIMRVGSPNVCVSTVVKTFSAYPSSLQAHYSMQLPFV